MRRRFAAARVASRVDGVRRRPPRRAAVAAAAERRRAARDRRGARRASATLSGDISARRRVRCVAGLSPPRLRRPSRPLPPAPASKWTPLHALALKLDAHSPSPMGEWLAAASDPRRCCLTPAKSASCTSAAVYGLARLWSSLGSRLAPDGGRGKCTAKHSRNQRALLSTTVFRCAFAAPSPATLERSEWIWHFRRASAS